MNSIATLGKYLDQPHLIRKFHKAMPALLVTGATAYGIHDTLKAPEEKRGKRFIKNALVLGATVTSALVAVRGLKVAKIKIPGLIEKPELPPVKVIDDFIKSGANKLKQGTRELLEKSKEKVLSLKEIASLNKDLAKIKGGKELFDEIIPPPKDLNAKEIAGEIGRLSLLGAIPVIGGILGGIAGCFAVGERGKEFKDCTKDKVKEGTYQYLANIVLCNVGAAGALGIMETSPVKNLLKAKNINSKFARAGAMVAGIAAVGIFGGSAIANFIGNKVINPLFGDKSKSASLASTGLNRLYCERHPEALDIALHTDDIATVGVMSGFSWIEPALPIMYSISGYRAGMGYRNGEGKGHRKHRKHHQNKVAGANPLMNSAKANNDAFSHFLTIKQRGKNFLD